ncbi:hypothetical protein CspHIS471_0206290 [Cutaneotrichosporon sp. HIS471]|nr:hypothetical protein CspHIS471_0206290 [Cutaneotrichosporon sp. HIS471]
MTGASSSNEADASPRQGSGEKKRRLNTTRTSQACTRCRSLKMKCIGATDPPCRRCRRTGATCDFIPRANAARPWSPGPYPSLTCTELWRNEVNNRLKALETANARLEALVAGREQVSTAEPAPPFKDRLDLELERGSSEPQFTGVLSALERLKQELPAHLARDEAWAPQTVTRLFRDHMPGLHFFSGQVSFSHPTPLLAVSILYIAAAHYTSPGMGQFQPVYFAAFTRAVGTLTVPDCPIRGACSTGEDGEPVSAKFDDVLGIILVGLLALGWVDTVGMWVNTAYRLLLDGMAEERSRRLHEWRSLWEGLRTIELEHSSLHLICPALPREPPDPPFSSTAPQETRDAGGSIGQLLAIMQRCMPRFVGRGLPTVWETVCGTGPPSQGGVSTEPEDMAAIQTWAAEIDGWYRKVAAETVNATNYIKSITLLNYHLHKIFVLSIFFPLRGISYTSASERIELLQSARVVLKIEQTFEVWSSWDLVMVTNASLVLLQAYSQGAGQQEDIDLIQYHLNLLNGTHQTAPSLRHTLSTRLETALQAMRTPVSTLRPLPTMSPGASRENVDQAVDWQFQAQPQGAQPMQPAPVVGHQDRGFLFMDQVPDLGMLPTVTNIDVGNNVVAEWPPFLVNLFGYDNGGGHQQFQGPM